MTTRRRAVSLAEVPTRNLPIVLHDLEQQALDVAAKVKAVRREMTRRGADPGPEPTRSAPAVRAPRPAPGSREVEHGTDRGYFQHRRLGEQPCEDCRGAHSKRGREDRKRWAEARAQEERGTP